MKSEVNNECVRESKTIEEEIVVEPIYPVNFGLLCELVDESDRRLDFADTIMLLEMAGIPMTSAVRKLGICAGVLYG